MSQTFSLYIINEDLLPVEYTGNSDEETFEQLIVAVETNGKLHQVVEMTEDDFIDALESIDTIVEGNRLLPNCAMNNSPHEVLDKMNECPYFGYFTPAQAQELYYFFEGLSEDSVDTIESVETHSEVFEAFRTAVAEAGSSEAAVAVLHA
jgi:hypothetical protein